MPFVIILIADDNVDDARLVLRALEAKGAEGDCRIVSDGTEVLRYLAGEDEFSNRERFPFPSLIILDLKMHRLDGLDTLKRMCSHREWSRIPVVVLSGWGELADVKHAYELGAKTFFVKPLLAEDIEQIRDLASPDERLNETERKRAHWR
jgi:DNA-binding response OmpR family regulator